MILSRLKYLRKKAADFLKDESRDASLESKIYHSFCYMSIVASIFSFFINLYVDMKIVMWMSVAIFFFQSYCCYLSKVKGKLNLAIIISSTGFHILLCFNYLYNAGIAGPTLLLTTLTLFFIIIIEKNKSAVYWVCLNIIIATALLLLEYLNKDFVIVHYNTREDLFLDMYFTYLIIIAVIYNGTVLLRKNYQEQKKYVTEKAIALEKLNAEKDKLFSLISHDLRTPLANVQQYLEMMAVVELTFEERRAIEKDLLHITRNTQDLLINLLQWSRNQMDGVEVNLQSCNLLEEISKTLGTMQLLAVKKEISLVVKIQDKCTVFADVDMLNLIIRNLLHNAVKFTPFGGIIEIGVRTVENGCLIYVKDNGAGISLEKQKEIFTLKTKTTFGTNKEKGTGIGLMLCKEYVEMQNGQIWFKSEENVGTTFYLSFPKEETIQDKFTAGLE